MPAAAPPLIPLWIKIAYTAFVAILFPIYLKNYGPTNFLFFCDVALLGTAVAIWLESPLMLSAFLVGIFVPQMIWVVDFLGEVVGFRIAGMTGYMFKPPFFLRFLSFFHFWLPFLLIYLVWKVGFDRCGIVLWTAIMWVLLTVCYAWMPPCSPQTDAAGNAMRDPNIPVNINYVHNIMSDNEPQTLMHPDLYLASYKMILVGIYLATHLLFAWLIPAPRRLSAEQENPQVAAAPAGLADAIKRADPR